VFNAVLTTRFLNHIHGGRYVKTNYFFINHGALLV
jgi:hypothetical protein